MKIINKKPNIYYLAFVFFAFLYVVFYKTGQSRWEDISLFILVFVGTYIYPFSILMVKPSRRFEIFTAPIKKKIVLLLIPAIGFFSLISIIYYIVPEVSVGNKFLILFLSAAFGTAFGTVREWREYKKLGI